MTRVEAVAAAFCLPVAEVAKWPGHTVDTFHRIAIRRGWLIQAEHGTDSP